MVNNNHTLLHGVRHGEHGLKVEHFRENQRLYAKFEGYPNKKQLNSIASKTIVRKYFLLLAGVYQGKC